MQAFHRRLAAALLGLSAATWAATLASAAPADAGSPSIVLTPCQLPDIERPARCGVFHVPETRGKPGSRTLPLKVVVLPARSGKPAATPIFFLSGGPGEAATDAAPHFAQSWESQDHDMVLMDLRGTGEGHRLDCDLGGGEDGLQQYMQPLFFQGVAYAACRKELEGRADLSQYNTPISMQDLDALRQALGYDRINLLGVSYGTRAAMTYIRMYGQHVRAAMLSGISPFENRAPLHHPAAAQRAFDELAKQCAADAACHAAYPDPKGDLAAILARLHAEPAKVTIKDTDTGQPTVVTLPASAFGDGLRVMLYSVETGRRVPLLLKQARAGDFTAFAEAAVAAGRGWKANLHYGLLLSVSCTEDVARIRPEEVDREAGGSFTGAYRVRGQMAACSVWPKTVLPKDYAAPFTSQTPVLLVSGALDPVTPPSWGEVARRSLPNSVHLVAPGAHASDDDCAAALGAELFRTGSLKGLDTGCLANEPPPPPFVLPGAGA